MDKISDKENANTSLLNLSIDGYKVSSSTSSKLCNLSFGALAVLNGNQGAHSSAALLNTSNQNNESFDADRLKLDVYEKDIMKLANENKALRKRVKKLTELARSKEEQLIEAFNEAYESKRKNDERNQLEHNAQLQSYYECFLQIEKENDTLKTKMEEMKETIEVQQTKLNELQEKQKEVVQSGEKREETARDSEHEDIKLKDTKRDYLNRLSLKHIDDELSNVNLTIKQFIENKHIEFNQVINNQINSLKETPDVQDDVRLKNEKIVELELEKEALSKKLNSIESSLARWIFRACDYKSDMDKANEKCMELESKLQEIDDKYSLVKKDNEHETRVLKSELSEKTNMIEKLKVELASRDKRVHTLSESNESLERLVHELEEKLKKPDLSDVQTQTLNDPYTKMLITNNKTGVVAQTAAKLSQLIKSSSNSHVASLAHENNEDTTSKTKAAPNQLIAECIQNENLANANRRIEILTNEIEQLKAKMDSITQENHSLMTQNQQLAHKLHSKPAPVVKVSTVAESKPEVPSVKTECKQVQTVRCAFQSVQTQTIESNELQQKLDRLRKELDMAKYNKLDEINKLEEMYKNEKAMNFTFNKQIGDLKERLEQLCKENELIRQEYESKLDKMNSEYKVEKQVSDTIIQQQKKLLHYLQVKLNGDDQVDSVPVGSNFNGEPSNFKSLINRKFKFNTNASNSNPLLANLHKTSNQQIATKQQDMLKQVKQQVAQTPVAQIQVKDSKKEIEDALNSSYAAYSELKNKKLAEEAATTSTQSSNKNAERLPNKNEHQSQTNLAPSLAANPVKKQIHVFITGLNTCPTYCHVCQELIPIIAYASKCQLCSFTCHSTCSSTNGSNTIGAGKHKSFKSSNNSNLYDPLKYCHINYLTNRIDYNYYINRLINFNNNQVKQPNNNRLLSDYLFINVDNKWKKLWIVLRLDQPQLDLYQSKQNHKPFDSINLINERIQVETNIKQIKKIIGTQSTSSLINLSEDENNIYQELNEFINFEQSSLIILLHSTKISLKIGFTSFNKKNIWYDALQSSILMAQSHNIQPTTTAAGGPQALQVSKKTPYVAIDSIQNSQFKLLNVNKALKPFLELCDTVVNSYCFINENLIALACDDGLYALNSFVNSNMNNIYLVKIDSIESAHKLYYQSDFNRLCFIGRKSRQLLSIDINELNEGLINDEVYELDDEETKSIRVRIEHIHNIDRCHLFECSVLKDGYWYLSVATPETIFILLFNKDTNKYTMVKTIQTPNDAPCLCIKFTNTNQLIYGCGKEFYKLDLNFLQTSTIIESSWKKIQDEFSTSQQPIAICVINSNQSNSPNEAVLLCYEEYGLFLIYNSVTNAWQQPLNTLTNSTTNKKSSSSSINSNTNASASVNYLKWPRGNGLTPLQIEYNASFLYLFYNDSIVVYKIQFDSDFSLNVKKYGVTFVYKPRYLSTLDISSTNTNCLIISNRRPIENQNGTIESSVYDTTGSQGDEDELYDELSNVRAGGSLCKLTDVEQDLNDKICLSYFSPADNIN